MPEEKKEDKKISMNSATTFDKNSIVTTFNPPLVEGEYPIFSVVITNIGYRFGCNATSNNYTSSVLTLGNLDIIREILNNQIISNITPKPHFDEDGELDYIG